MRARVRVFAPIAAAVACSIVLAAQAPAPMVPAPPSSTPAALPAAAEVVARHITALGGAAAFKAVKSFHASGRFEISGVGLGGQFDLYAARPNRLILRMTIPGIGVIEQGFNGKVGWTLNPLAGPELLDGRELREAQDDAWFDRLLYEPDRVKSLTTVERLQFDGRPAYKVKVVLQSGTEAFDYFDVETGLQIGTEAERATPQGVLQTTTVFKEHRQFGPIKQPSSFVQRAIGLEQVVTVASVEYDKVTDSAFAVPPAIAALVDQ
jgi:hypothetical protein